MRSGAATRYVLRPWDAHILRFSRGGLRGQKLGEGQRPPEHRSFRVTPISGRFSLFHRGETEAQRGRRRGLCEDAQPPALAPGPVFTPTPGCASRGRRRGGRNSSGSREQRSDFCSSPASPHPEQPRFLREDLGKTRPGQETLYLGAREGGREEVIWMGGAGGGSIHIAFGLKKKKQQLPD